MMAHDMDLAASLADFRETIESRLDRLLSHNRSPGEMFRPGNLLDAMRYAVLNGGKRIRPFLLVETARSLGYEGEGALLVGCALECIHCYSLIHDDLPAMDNDDFRRGKPTVHKVFDEATAILAGDGLLSLAFVILSDTDLGASQKVELTVMLAHAIGVGGMVGGQSLDVSCVNPDAQQLAQIHRMKSGALFRFACEAGAVIAEARDRDRALLRSFGMRVGIIFQLIDDHLDNGTKQLSPTSCNSPLTRLMNEAKSQLSGLSTPDDNLKKILYFAANRTF